jgi:hypothetical protein
MNDVSGSGTREAPWLLETPSGSSEYQMYRDENANPHRTRDNELLRGRNIEQMRKRAWFISHTSRMP